ncbi:MAG: alpha/beta fold hydrolase, partial [Gammaproteobacteria bacterium]|nr:alpha/beta fold hydrolase [Gammaproteobacteria bacterium]
LQAQGHQRVMLAGHSLGAVKSIFTQATDPVADLAGVIALSPPRLCHEAQVDSVNGKRFVETYERARELAASGRGDDLFAAVVPIPAIFAAAQYVKKYGPENRYDLARHFPNVACPALLVLGTKEARDLVSIGATAALVEDLQKSVRDLSVRMFEGADHAYTGMIDDVCAALIEWLREVE